MSQGKCSGEPADTAHYFGTHGLLHVLLHQFYRLVACFDVYSSFLVIHFLLISAAGALSFYLVGQPLKRSRILCLIFLFFHAFQVSFIADLLQFCILGFYLFF